jgi:hypothetical protein
LHNHIQIIDRGHVLGSISDSVDQRKSATWLHLVAHAGATETEHAPSPEPAGGAAAIDGGESWILETASVRYIPKSFWLIKRLGSAKDAQKRSNIDSLLPLALYCHKNRNRLRTHSSDLFNVSGHRSGPYSVATRDSADAS